MAKKKEKQIPFKQQVYESMLTSQLYGNQPTQEEKIQKSYDEWKANKDTTARIQERYDAWLAEKNKTKEPQEPSQPIKATTTPKAETKTKKEPKEKEQKSYLTHQDVMPKLTKRSNDVTNYPEMAELEKGGSVDLYNRPKVNTSELKKSGWKNAGDGEATVFSSTYTNTKGDKAGNFTPIVTDAKGNYLRTLSEDELTKYAEDVLEGKRKDDLKLQIGKTHGGKKAIDNAVSAAERVHELQEDYYMNPKKSKADEAFKKKDIVGGSVKQLDLSKYNLPNTGITEEDFALEKTKIKGKNQKKGAVNKKGVLESAARGAAKTPFRASKFLADTGVDVYQSVAEPAAQIVDELTGSGFDNRAKVREKAEELRERVNRNYADLKEEEAEARAQHPGAFGAGNAATQLAMYYVTNPLFDSIGKGIGVTSKAGQFALNQLGQNIQDVALDTLPTLAEMRDDGRLSDEERNELLKQGLINAGMNFAIPGAQYGLGKSEQALYESLGKSVGNNADVLKSMDATGTVRDIKNATKQIPKFDTPSVLPSEELARLNTNPLEANNRQFSELMNDYNSQFKDDSAMRNIFTPEDVEASQNRQLATLMDEYRARSAANDLAENVAEPVTKTTIPELGRNAEPFVRQDLNTRNSFIREDLNRRLPTMNEDIDTLNPILEERQPFTRETIGESAEAINPTPSTLDLPDEVWDKLDSRFVEIAEPLNKVERSGIMESVTDEKALKEWAAVNEAYSDYLNKAMFSGSIDEANAAKKTLDAARKRYSRAMKDIDPEISREFNSGSFGNQIGRPIYDRNVKAVEDSSQETADLINELENSVPENVPNATGSWLDNLEPVPRENIDTSGPRPYAINQEEKPLIKNTAEEIERWAEENGLVDEEEDLVEQAIDNVTQKKVPGANKLQFFGKDGNNGTWKTGKWRINTAEKTGRIKNPDDVPIRNYAYRAFTEEEQNQVAKERYKASKDIAADLMRQDRFDEVDIKAAMNEWQRFMDSNDTKALKRANLLSYKIDKEVRDAGRVDQALQEFTRNTPAGQVRVAQQAIDDIVDKYRGKGTSEALDNIVSKLYKAYEDSNGDKDIFAKKAEEILSGTLRQHVGGKKAIKMSAKAIQGKNYILDMISKGASMEDIAEQVYKKNGGVKLTIEEQKKVYDYLKEAARYPKDSREQEELLSKAAKIVTARSPATLGQMARSFLYNNMLGNFKTALSRNAFGNLGYQTLEQARQPIAAGVDYLTSKVTGKHSTLGWNKEKAVAYAKGFKKGLKDQVLDMSKHIDTGRSGQMGWEIALKNNATTFNDTKPIGKFLNGVEYYVRNAMELGDRPFYEGVYNQSYTELMQLLDRYGKDGVAGLEGIKDEDIPAMVDMISSVRAADSVFQKHGKMSKGLTDIRNGLGEMSQGILGTDILSTAAGAFTMTPGNMIERAIEYTPIGFLKNAVETGIETVGKKGFNQRRFVDEASRSIAGLPILGTTYAMAKNGMINKGYSTDPDEKAAQQEDGFIEYGFNVPEEVPYYGGKTWDTSDIPVVGPFMQAGSVIAEEGITPKASMQAAEAVLGSSATQGFRRAFGSDAASYSSQNSMVDNLANTVLSSGSQLVPSLLRQTAQTIDPYKRDLGEYGTPEYYVNLMKNNIPGVRQTLPVKTNVEGEKVLQNQGRGLGAKILENYVLPMNVSEYKPSPLNTEASRLKQTTGENSGFAPKAKRSDLRNWDEADHSRYSEEQFRKYKEDLGKLNSSAGNALTDSKFYKGLSDEDKVKYLGDMYKTMKKVARKNATGHLDKEDKALNTYLNAGGGKKGTQALIDYYQHKHIFGKYDVSESDGANALYEKYGEKGIKNYSRVKKALRGSQKGDDIESAINSTLPTLSKNEKAIYYSYIDPDAKPGANPYGYVAGINYKPEKDPTYQKAKGVIPNLTPEKFYETRDAIDKWGDESRGKSYGNGNISEDEMIPYLNAHAANLAEAQSIYAAYGNPGTNKKGVTKHVVQKGGKYDLSY